MEHKTFHCKVSESFRITVNICNKTKPPADDEPIKLKPFPKV